MEKHVYVVTHGAKFSGANPGMTAEGFYQVAKLRSLLPAEINAVVCGTGRRHLDVAEALGLYPTRYTSAVGGPDSGECLTGNGTVDVVRLPGNSGVPEGTLVPYAIYTTLIDTALAMQAVICGLPHNSVVCAGRPSMIMLDMDESASKSAAVYKVVVMETPDFKGRTIRLITEVSEILATGEAEIHAV